MEEQFAKQQFDLKAFKRWRDIQMGALFPLILIGALMIYFKEPSVLGIVCFFLVLIVGVLLPQMRADSILSHVVLTRELEQRIQSLEDKLVKGLEERLQQ
jgi:hypothetical protein